MITPTSTQRVYRNIIVTARDETGQQYTWYVRGNTKNDNLEVVCEKFVNAYYGSSYHKVPLSDVERLFNYLEMDIGRVTNLEKITKG